MINSIFIIMNDTYKYIEYKDNNVIITHYILDEYEEEVDNPNITFEIYKKQTIDSYNLAQELNYCKLLNNDDNEIIQISMDKYTILYDVLSTYTGKNPFVNKFCELLNEMYINKIIHMDFAPRNIGIDTNGNFKLIDLDSLFSFNDNQEFIKWMYSFQFEFKFTGLGKKYNKVCDKFIQEHNLLSFEDNKI